MIKKYIKKLLHKAKEKNKLLNQNIDIGGVMKKQRRVSDRN